MPLAIFGIENDGLNLAVNLVILFAIVVWLSLVAYTFLDARRRIDDAFLVGCATIASLIFPLIGTLVYTILRPPEFLEDARERELEIRAAELRLRQLADVSCPNCEQPIDRSWLRCPRCRARIKDPCESCGKPIDPRWSVCPWCETPTRRARAPRRRAAAPSREGAAPREAGSPRPVAQPRKGAPARSAGPSREGATPRPAPAKRSARPAQPAPSKAQAAPSPAEQGNAASQRSASPARGKGAEGRTARSGDEGKRTRAS
jgi:hypothetical protein